MMQPMDASLAAEDEPLLAGSNANARRQEAEANATAKDAADGAVAITISDEDPMLELKIKTLSEKPIAVSIIASANVAALKEAITKQAHAEGKFLRLIHQGKMLSDDRATLASCKIKSGDFIHCAISAVPPKAVINQISTQQEPEENDEPQRRRGFDRLRDRLSREEIQALRLYFYPQLSAYIAQAPRVEGESSEDRIYRLEEEWMSAQGPQSEFALNVVPAARIAMDHQMEMQAMSGGSFLGGDNEGTGTEFLWGFLMGLLLGVFMLLMLLDRTVPRKQKIGLLLGVSMNFFLSVVPKAVTDP